MVFFGMVEITWQILQEMNTGAGSSQVLRRTVV
jgi:hypothetical protein